jgi:hypothetical protein
MLEPIGGGRGGKSGFFAVLELVEKSYLDSNIQAMHRTYRGVGQSASYLVPIRISMQKPIGVGRQPTCLVPISGSMLKPIEGRLRMGVFGAY